jgi:transcriptional regulator with XRE-family HTH domain
VLSYKLMSAYFTMESRSGSGMATFADLKKRLIKIVNSRILNGEFTERGLARILGISQPQIHNVLKGARRLSGDLADRLLTTLGLRLIDLFCEEEFQERHKDGQQGSRIPSEREGDWHFLEIAPNAPKKPPLAETRVRKGRAVAGN